jgi:hypothetical protein
MLLIFRKSSYSFTFNTADLIILVIYCSLWYEFGIEDKAYNIILLAFLAICKTVTIAYMLPEENAYFKRFCISCERPAPFATTGTMNYLKSDSQCEILLLLYYLIIVFTIENTGTVSG